MKNKNKPDEELKKIKGDLYYSDSEKQLYRIKDDTQTPVSKDDVKGIWNDIETSYKETGETIRKIFEGLGVASKKDNSDDDSALPFI